MQAYNDYKFLRSLETFEDDPDFVASQTIPKDVVVLQSPPTSNATVPVRLKVELVLEWLDEGGGVVTTGRGTYDFQAIRVAGRRAPLQGDAVVDTVILHGQLSHRPVVMDDLLPGDRLAVRVTNMLPPERSEKARILYREIF